MKRIYVIAAVILLFVAACAPAASPRTEVETYVGIGVALEPGPNGIGAFISAVLPDSPAARAGLPADVQILEVDGVETTMLPAEDIVALIRGPEGSTVTLLVIAQGTDTADTYILQRARLAVPPEG